MSKKINANLDQKFKFSYKKDGEIFEASFEVNRIFWVFDKFMRLFEFIDGFMKAFCGFCDAII
jgi:hypothetical protein